jgi:elongation factor G
MKRYDKDILLKETLRSEARGYHKLKKQNGGPGQFAIVELIMRPLARGGGFRFLNSVIEGRIPDEFVPSLEKGTREALARGGLAGFPVVDVQVEVLDGAHHRKDSHGRDFQTAGRMAVQNALCTGKSAFLEPLGAFEIGCPTGAIGAVLGRLSARRAHVREMDFQDTVHVIRGEIPFLELEGLESELRSLTSGSGTFQVSASHDDLMPESITEAVLRQLREEQD